MSRQDVCFSMNSVSSLGHPITTESSQVIQQRLVNSSLRHQAGQSLTRASAETAEKPPTDANARWNQFLNKIRGNLTLEDQVYVAHGLLVVSAYLSLGLPIDDMVQRMGLFYWLLGLGIGPFFVPALVILTRAVVWRVKKLGGGTR